MNKNIQNTSKNKTFTTIDLYNQRVKDCIQKTTLTEIQQYSIKNFLNKLQRKRLSIQKYNQEVEEYNNNFGFFILKKQDPKAVKQAPKEVKSYNYINYPYLDREAVKLTMRSYRKHVVAYNNKREKENEIIIEYNESVKFYFDLTKEEKQSIVEFKKTESARLTREYNEAVEIFNSSFKTPILLKNKIKKIRPVHELTFNVLLGFYISQLKKRNGTLKERDKSTRVLKNALPLLKIDHRKLSTHTIDDIQRLDYSKRTVQEHVRILIEAGVFTNYNFYSQKRPIYVNISADILTILDGFSPKRQSTEKQHVNKSFLQTQHYLTDTTRSFILKEEKIKDFAKAKVDKCGSSLETKPNFYNFTEGTATKNKNYSAAKISQLMPKTLNTTRTKSTKNLIPHENKYTKKFLSKLSCEKQLAKELKSGKYNSYSGFRYDYLTNNVLQYAKISFVDFRKIVIQDFIKSSSKIWKNHNVYEGEWRKTLNYLQENLFKNITEKDLLVSKLKEYRWKIDFARKWFLKTEVSALFPYAYFDITRKKQSELGFYGLHSVWKTHLEYSEKNKVRKKSAQIKSNIRNQETTNENKFKSAVSRYLDGKYSVERLQEYVAKNLPESYVDKLNSLIIKPKNLA